jgi:tripartite-type tricarboxylate transporter receptor subunit TctC
MTQQTRRGFLKLSAATSAGSLLAASGLLLPGMSSRALGQGTFPQRPITIIQPWGPQSWGFLQAQELATALEPILGVRVLVQAKPGGASALGTKFVADARPDGYTLLHGWIAGLVMVPLTNPDPGYDPLNDFYYFSRFTESPVVAVSRADAPWNTLAEMVEHVRANPGERFAFSGGPALSLHSISGAEVFQRAGVDVRGVFYDDAAAAGAAMLGGDTHVAMDGFAALVRYGDRVKAIGVFSDRRFPGFENVSTVAEQGLDAPSVHSWSALMAPIGIPEDVRSTLGAAFHQVLSNPEFQKKIVESMQWFVRPSDGAEVKRLIVDSTEQLREPVARVQARQG